MEAGKAGRGNRGLSQEEKVMGERMAKGCYDSPGQRGSYRSREETPRRSIEQTEKDLLSVYHMIARGLRKVTDACLSFFNCEMSP